MNILRSFLLKYRRWLSKYFVSTLVSPVDVFISGPSLFQIGFPGKKNGGSFPKINGNRSLRTTNILALFFFFLTRVHVVW